MITAEQKQQRRAYLGSSEIGAVMGLDPYQSAADVWLQKRGVVSDFDGNAATDVGNALEKVLLDWAHTQLGVAFQTNIMKVSTDGLRAANFDGIVPEWQPTDKFVVEAKTTGIVGPADPSFGDPNTDQVPDRVVVQVHHQLEIAGEDYRIGYVPVLVGGKGFSMYVVERNDELIEVVRNRGVDFMRKVLDGIEPDNFRPSPEVLKRVKRVPNKTVPLESELADRLVLARAACKRAGEEKDEAERALLAVLLDAEQGECENGTIVTYMASKRKGYVVEDTTYRTLRVKPAKGS